MKSRTGKKVITTMLGLSLVTAFAVVCHAWFINGDNETSDSAFGAVDVAISDATEIKDGKLAFTITNNSTIDAYLRLGWTPIVKRANDGREMTGNLSTVTVKAEAGMDAPAGLVLNAVKVFKSDGYAKNMIIMEDGDGKYFVVPAGTDINGTITVEGWEGNQGEALHLILVPEAIQASLKAVEAAAGYGWDSNQVGGQAGAIRKGAVNGG